MEKFAFHVESGQEALVDALQRGQTVEVVHHGRVLGTVMPKTRSAAEIKAREKAMAGFFGMHKHLPVETVEEEARAIRRGRNRRFDDL